MGQAISRWWNFGECCCGSKGRALGAQLTEAKLPPPAGPPPPVQQSGHTSKRSSTSSSSSSWSASASGRVQGSRDARSKRASATSHPAFYDGEDIHGPGVRRKTQIIKEVDQGMLANATNSNPLTANGAGRGQSPGVERMESGLAPLGGSERAASARASARNAGGPRKVSVDPRPKSSSSVIGAPPPMMAFGDPDA